MKKKLSLIIFSFVFMNLATAAIFDGHSRTRIRTNDPIAFTLSTLSTVLIDAGIDEKSSEELIAEAHAEAKMGELGIHIEALAEALEVDAVDLFVSLTEE